jgi:hypothetical protein
MQNGSLVMASAPEAAQVTRFKGPIWTLIVLSPVIAEVLSGSTRLSFLFPLAFAGSLILARKVWQCKPIEQA